MAGFVISGAERSDSVRTELAEFDLSLYWRSIEGFKNKTQTEALDPKENII
jgi:hypothetical protein